MNSFIKTKKINFNHEKKLLHFGLDYIVLNLHITSDPVSQSYLFLNSIFKTPHNTTNSNSLEDFAWGDTKEKVNIFFIDTPQGEGVDVIYNGIKIIRIVKVSKKWAKNIRYKYSYLIDYYGNFFALERNKLINTNNFYSVFINDIKNKKITSSISRIDICSDLAGFTTKDIFNKCQGVNNLTTTRIAEKNGIPETIYFGKKTSNNKGVVRAYNKKIEVSAKSGKKKYFFDYFLYEYVTRLEAEIKSNYCKKFNITFEKIFDNSFLFSLYVNFLNNKSRKFKISKFIEKELKNRGYQKMIIDIKNINQGKTLAFETYRQKFKNIIITVCEVYAKDPIEEIINDNELYAVIKSNKEAFAVSNMIIKNRISKKIINNAKNVFGKQSIIHFKQ